MLCCRRGTFALGANTALSYYVRTSLPRNLNILGSLQSSHRHLAEVFRTSCKVNRTELNIFNRMLNVDPPGVSLKTYTHDHWAAKQQRDQSCNNLSLFQFYRLYDFLPILRRQLFASSWSLPFDIRRLTKEVPQKVSVIYVFNNFVWPSRDVMKNEVALVRKKVPHCWINY